MGSGAGYSRSQCRQLLESYLDCVVVHEIGFTLTLYRQKGLPRPSNCCATEEKREAGMAAAAGTGAAAPAAAAAAAAGGSGAGNAAPKRNSSKQQASDAKARQKFAKKLPPEFTAA